MRKFIILSLLFCYTQGFSQNINKIEYFVDADPGYGSGTNVPVTVATPVTANFSIPLTSISDGFHFLTVRARDVSLNWSIAGVRPFYKETFPSTIIPNITALEYFLDADPGYGLATSVAVTAGSPITQSFTVVLPNTVADGFHFLSVRGKDVNNKWAMVGIRPFYKETFPTTTIPNITTLEYFLDADPGYGLATSVAVTSGSPITQSFTVALPNTVTDGFHFISVRGKDANNKWSEVGVRPFYKETISTGTISNITQIEYFLDADPGFGLATTVAITANSPLTQNFTVALPNTVADGFHYLNIRAKDINNKWSVLGIRPFYKETIPANVTPPNIAAMEYFVDADPGYGLGTSVALTAGTPVSKSFTANLGSLSNGIHKLTIRAKDANNRWGVVGIKEFGVQDNIVIIGNIPTSWCKITNFNIPYTVTGTYTSGNIFTAQLSDATGSFSSPTTLGTLTATTSGTIVGTIPNTIVVGTGYLIRVISSTPSITNSPTKTIDITAFCQCLLNASLATGNWGTAGIWSCGHIPLATEPVQISSGHTVTLDVNGTAKSLDLRGILNQQLNKALIIQGN
ncbi:MAG: hypothetical protein V4585_10105 [Bacteroidota bacterium]|jgi:hypothetical protein